MENTPCTKNKRKPKLTRFNNRQQENNRHNVPQVFHLLSWFSPRYQLTFSIKFARFSSVFPKVRATCRLFVCGRENTSRGSSSCGTKFSANLCRWCAATQSSFPRRTPSNLAPSAPLGCRGGGRGWGAPYKGLRSLAGAVSFLTRLTGQPPLPDDVHHCCV